MIKLPFNVDFSNKVAVITGAGGVLCSTMAMALAQSGAKVALLDLNKEAVEQIAVKITKEGFVAKGYEANVLDKAQLALAHEKILKDFGKCDFLINGAGGNNKRATTDDEFYTLDAKEGVKTFFDLDESGINFVFNLNFLGTLLVTQEFSKDMLGREGCSVLNVSSMNAFTPLTKIPAYSAAKSGVSNFTQWLAVYFSKVKIRVNAIAPGFLLTNQNRDLLFDENSQPRARALKILTNTPMERLGVPDELVGAVLFLLSNEAASFITGAVLPIDGGFSAYSGV